MQITRLGKWGYDFADLSDGPADEIICHPGNALIEVAGDLTVGTYDTSLHSANMQSIFGDRVLHIHEQDAIVFWFPIPVWRFVVYVSSDTHNLDRLCEMKCFWRDEYVAGDSAHTPFGPCPDGPREDGTRDFQYMVAMRSPNAFPGYEPTPMDRAVFYPMGSDVYIGAMFAKVDP